MTHLLDKVNFLTEEGYGADEETFESGIPPNVLTIDAAREELGEDRVPEIGTELGATHFVFQHELVFDRTGKPRLLSERNHYTLGTLATDGKFEAIASVLDSEHPARTAVD